jgi:DNA-binding SARP family transcriptional activator/sugar lactone lactonase YvrE
MEFKILGPFDVCDREGRDVHLPAGRERLLLVLLLVHRGEVVSTDEIIDVLWGDQPPGAAAKAVQGYISHLRRLLEPDHERSAGDGLLFTRPPGYALRADDVAVDATRFERLADEGRRALEDGSPAEAVATLEEGLALWRGSALAEFAFDDFAQAEIHRLEELRLAATEDRVESLLQLGRHGELVGQLESLVAAHPLRERLRGQLMLALYRSGRQADALQVYRDGRRLLAADLGLDPSPELQRLERAILAQDPALEAPVRVPSPAQEHEPPQQPPTPTGPRRRRRRSAIATGVVLAVVAAGVLAFALARDEAPAAVDVVTPAVVAVDPDTNRVVASIAAGSRPAAIAAGDGGVWVGDARDGTVTRIDPVSRAVVKTIGIGAPAIDLATGAGSVWVATGGFGTVVRIDAELGAVADRIELGEPNDPVVPAVSSVGVGQGRVWVGAFDGLVRIDPASGEIAARVDLGRSPALQIAAGGGAVWATIIANRAKRVEARSAQVTAEFYAGGFVFPIAVDRTAVWVGGGQGQVWKIDPVTGSTLLTARSGSFASAIALGDDVVWVALPDERAIMRLDQETGEVQATIPVGGAPEDLVVSDGLVWVAVQKTPAGG